MTHRPFVRPLPRSGERSRWVQFEGGVREGAPFVVPTSLWPDRATVAAAQARARVRRVPAWAPVRPRSAAVFNTLSQVSAAESIV